MHRVIYRQRFDHNIYVKNTYTKRHSSCYLPDKKELVSYRPCYLKVSEQYRMFLKLNGLDISIINFI